MIQNFEEFVNENIWQEDFAAMINESKSYTIPTFGTLDDIKKFLKDNNIINEEKDKWFIAYFYKQYKGNHVYLSFALSQGFPPDVPQTYHSEIWISANNKKPSFFNKVRADFDKSSYGKDILQFIFSNGEVDINKETTDKWFGKLMPHTSGTPDTVVSCFNAYLQELAMDGGNEWQYLKKY